MWHELEVPLVRPTLCRDVGCQAPATRTGNMVQDVQVLKKAYPRYMLHMQQRMVRLHLLRSQTGAVDYDGHRHSQQPLRYHTERPQARRN